jgi:hypothetical protein
MIMELIEHATLDKHFNECQRLNLKEKILHYG